MNASPSCRIFISYSHRARGPEWKGKLLKTLEVFERHSLLDVWEDGKIRVSAAWNDDITQAMASANLAVFLLTPQVLDPRTPEDPNYILQTELPFIRDRWERERIPVFPVVCEPCRWKEQEESKWLHAIQSPAGAEPLSSFPDDVVERHLRSLATAIAGELSAIALGLLSQPAGDGARARPEARTFLDKFPLTRGPGLWEERLIGREQELALLDLAFAQPHTAIVSLVAWGGVGKTMLVQHWLQRLQRESWLGTQRVYAWSFYSQGTKEDRQASEDTFLAHALEWFGMQCEPTLSPWDKGRLLADAVASEPTLLILDGIEPLQYPPDSMGGRLRAPGVQSLLKHLASKAKQSSPSPALAGEGRGEGVAGCLCLVTTREPLTDLADFQRREGSPWGSVLRVDLGNLTDEAGATLLHHWGANRAGPAEIKPDDKELLAASRDVDGHALTLNLLGRFLACAHRGDISRRDRVRFEKADREVQGGTTFKMLAAFENWFATDGECGARRKAALRLFGLFDRPATDDCLATLRLPPPIPGLTESLFRREKRLLGLLTVFSPIPDEAWSETVAFLEGFGLVSRNAFTPKSIWGYDRTIAEPELNTSLHGLTNGLPAPTEWLPHPEVRGEALDVHPLTREYCAMRLRTDKPSAWREANRRLFDYLSNLGPYWPEGLDGLKPLFEAVRHGCQAGFLEEARANVLRDRIMRGGHIAYSTKQLGAFDSELAAVSCFFDEPWQHVSAALDPRAQWWVPGVAGFDLRALGRLGEARVALNSSLAQLLTSSKIDPRIWIEAAKAASTLSELETATGNLAEAVRHASESVDYSDRHGLAFVRSGVRAILADALHQQGIRDAAAMAFREAEKIQVADRPEITALYSLPGFRYCEFLLHDAECAAWRVQLGLVLAKPAVEAAWTSCQQVRGRATEALAISTRENMTLEMALDHLSLGRSTLFAAVIRAEPRLVAQKDLRAAADGLDHSKQRDHVPRGRLTWAWLCFSEGDATGARADLDEAWDIAERGPMRLHMADIHLYRARLFFREKKYPWKSPQHDLAAAEKLINDCGYHRRDEELADAKRAILGT